MPCPANFRRDPFFSGTKQEFFSFPPKKATVPHFLSRVKRKKPFGRNFHLPSPFFSLPTHQQHSMPLYTTARSTTTVSHYPLGLYSPPTTSERNRPSCAHEYRTENRQSALSPLPPPPLQLCLRRLRRPSETPLPPSPSSSSSSLRGERRGDGRDSDTAQENKVFFDCNFFISGADNTKFRQGKQKGPKLVTFYYLWK